MREIGDNIDVFFIHFGGNIMQKNLTMNSLQTLLYFPFKDSGSRIKLLIASVLGFAGFIIPVIPWILILGYAGAVMKQIIVDGDEPSMPEWENWSEHLSLGGKLFGVNLIYSIPAWAPMVFGYFLMLLPIFLVEFFESSNYYPSASEGLAMLFSFGGMALFVIGMFFSLILWVVLPPAFAHVVAKNSFSAGFQIRGWWKVFKANIGGFIIAVVISGGLYMAFMFAMQIIYMTLILCILLPFLLSFMSAYLSIVIFALIGQAYRDGTLKLEEQTAE
jgi:hypothetical protein